MTNKSALQEVFEEGGDLTLRSYSGRGMFGTACLGVEGELSEIISSIVYGTTDENRDELAEAVKSIKTDSMGRGTIVYFPGTKYCPLDEGEECDEGE